MTPAFKTAVDVILGHEGGYVFHKNDPGGETKYGISKRAYPNVNIADLSRDQAKEIYFTDYWQKLRCDRLSYGVALVVFDFAVNAGVKRSIRTLQKVLGLKEDGVFGDITWSKTVSYNQNYIIEKFTTERILYYTRLNGFKDFGAGWVRRSIETMSAALLTKEKT